MAVVRRNVVGFRNIVPAVIYWPPLKNIPGVLLFMADIESGSKVIA